MGKIITPDKVKLIAGVTYKDEKLLKNVLDKLIGLCGIIDFRLEPYSFCYTDYYQDEMGEILNKLFVSFEKLIDSEKLPEIKIQNSTGVSATEAPRGILFHKYKFKDGKCTFANITTPTTQNLQNIEDGLKIYVTQLLKQGIEETKLKLEIEKLIRAYDPCISCSTHFLELNITHLH